MKILHEYPPIYAEIVAAFPEVANRPNGVFAFGNILYNPSGMPLAPYVIAHEEVHERQQKEQGVKQWWWTFLRSPQFRLEQELEAYRVEYREFCKMYKSREEQFKFLLYQAKQLSDAMYGNIITTSEAMKRIKQ